MINGNVIFEVLAIDTKDNCSIKTDKNLCYALLGHGSLWKHPVHSDTKITDGSIKCSISPVKADADMAAIFSKGFLVMMEGNYQDIEPLRSPLINHLKEQKFDSIYILTDHSSQNIACELYPLVYKVENLLRHYSSVRLKVE